MNTSRCSGDVGAWHQMTWREYADQACRVAAALQSLGVRPGDRVTLMLKNRPPWQSDSEELTAW